MRCIVRGHEHTKKALHGVHSDQWLREMCNGGNWTGSENCKHA